jgi:hypothetical protein
MHAGEESLNNLQERQDNDRKAMQAGQKNLPYMQAGEEAKLHCDIKKFRSK